MAQEVEWVCLSICHSVLGKDTKPRCTVIAGPRPDKVSAKLNMYLNAGLAWVCYQIIHCGGDPRRNESSQKKKRILVYKNKYRKQVLQDKKHKGKVINI